MRTLRRNKICIFYANYRDKVLLKDEYGNLTGEYDILYDNPKAIMANVSAARGEATTRQFGDDEGYDRVIVLDSRDATDILAQCGKFESQSKTIITDDGNGNVSIESEDIKLTSEGNVVIDLPPAEYVSRSSKFPIAASSIFWIDTLPKIAEDGSTDTPHDYIVKQIATSLNSVSIAVSKVNVRE
jgi:hypothetical protein